MKWSELFATVLGEKDVDVSNSTESEKSEQETSTVTKESDNSKTKEELNNSAQNFTKEQFDALNARIKELEQANKDLALKGTVDAPPAVSPEEIIYNLCVGRSNNGKQNSNTNTAEHGNR